jgi:SAM-dependent methyltransferase
VTADAPGAVPSPNIWVSPEVYEVENRGLDRAGVIETAMLRGLGRADLRGLSVLDVGCGTGFHLPRFAALGAALVVGVEPHAPLVTRAQHRISGMPGCQVRLAGAAATGLPDASVDVAHARWAYFFGPGCEPGLDELARVMRPSGTAYVIDNDATRSRFGAWFRAALPDYDPVAVERFWARHGWEREQLTVSWELDSRADFESVVRLEFAPGVAARILAAEPERTGVDHAVNLWSRRY